MEEEVTLVSREQYIEILIDASFQDASDMGRDFTITVPERFRQITCSKAEKFPDSFFPENILSDTLISKATAGFLTLVFDTVVFMRKAWVCE